MFELLDTIAEAIADMRESSGRVSAALDDLEVAMATLKAELFEKG